MMSYEKFIYYLKGFVHDCNHFPIVVRKPKSFFFHAQVGGFLCFLLKHPFKTQICVS